MTVFSPKNPPFNAAWDGAADDTAAIQACLSAAYGNGPVELPVGVGGKITAPLNIAGPITIRGEASEHECRLILGNPTADGLHVQTASPVHLERFGIVSASTQAAGAAISIPSDGVSSNSESRIERLYISGAYDGIVVTNAYGLMARNFFISEFAHNGIDLSHVLSTDGGRQVFSDYALAGAPGASYCFIHRSGGGTRIVSGKMLGARYGYALVRTLAPTTFSDFILANNSIEGQAQASVLLETAANLGFLRGQITGNQMGSIYSPAASSSWFQALSIVGNLIDVGNPLVHACIDVDGIKGLTISGNNLRNNNPGNGAYGIVTRGHVHTGYVGKNVMAGFAAATKYAIVGSTDIDFDP